MSGLSPEEVKRASALDELRKKYPQNCALHRDGSKHGRCFIEPTTNDHIILSYSLLNYWADAIVRVPRRAGVTLTRASHGVLMQF